MQLTLLALFAPVVFAACAAPARPAPTGAGTSATPSRSPRSTPPTVDVAALRAEGPAALTRLLAAYDVAPAAARPALAATIDRVAGQRYATVARLFWHTDLAAAQAAARASGKPILALRMLGHLDDDLSCANSRMFRTILYPDRTVAALLRDRFVLYWSSERPVPRVTIDYGDGRTLATTVTGNSAHYVLDADGRPLDVLPGLYAPAVFVAELGRIADQAARVRGLDDAAWRGAMLVYHRAAAARAAKQWGTVRTLATIDGQIAKAGQVEAAVAKAQLATVSKARVEVPMIRMLDLGVDPGAMPADQDVRTDAATRLWQLTPTNVVDASARALITSLLPPGAAADHAATFDRLTRGVLAETFLNDLALRQQIRTHVIAELAAGATPTFAALNTFVYADVFATPASDPWMGLLPRATYTGLPGGAIVSRR